MSTTIQVSEMTKQILETIKEEEHARSYDEIINHLVVQHKHIPTSMFGSLKGMEKWTKKNRGKFHGE